LLVGLNPQNPYTLAVYLKSNVGVSAVKAAKENLPGNVKAFQLRVVPPRDR
jgi:hypothetical protein